MKSTLQMLIALMTSCLLATSTFAQSGASGAVMVMGATPQQTRIVSTTVSESARAISRPTMPLLASMSSGKRKVRSGKSMRARLSVSTLVDGVVGALVDGSRSRSGARLRVTGMGIGYQRVIA